MLFKSGVNPFTCHRFTSLIPYNCCSLPSRRGWRMAKHADIFRNVPIILSWGLTFLSSLKGKLLGGFYITKGTKKIHAAVPDVCAPLRLLRFTGRINVVSRCKLYKHRRHYIELRHLYSQTTNTYYLANLQMWLYKFFMCTFVKQRTIEISGALLV